MSSTTMLPRATEDSAPAEPRWTSATLFAFRIVFVYCMLEWMPLIVMLNPPALTAGMLSGPTWWRTLNIAIGQWSITHVLGLQEHSPPRFSANNLSLFLGMIGLGVISVVLAVVWSALGRRRVSHAQLFGWVHTFMRFMVGALMLSYGWHKILPCQFPLTFDCFTLEVGQHSPRDLLWAFMGASREYQVFAGLLEVAGGLLLLTRRTAMLGALVSMAVMANVLALDLAYDAAVKFLAGQIFLMTLFVLAPFGMRLTNVFILNRETHPAQVPRFFQHKTADRITCVVGVIFAAWIYIQPSEWPRGKSLQMSGSVKRRFTVFGTSKRPLATESAFHCCGQTGRSGDAWWSTPPRPR